MHLATVAPWSNWPNDSVLYLWFSSVPHLSIVFIPLITFASYLHFPTCMNPFHWSRIVWCLFVLESQTFQLVIFSSRLIHLWIDQTKRFDNWWNRPIASVAFLTFILLRGGLLIWSWFPWPCFGTLHVCFALSFLLFILCRSEDWLEGAVGCQSLPCLWGREYSLKSPSKLESFSCCGISIFSLCINPSCQSIQRFSRFWCCGKLGILAWCIHPLLKEVGQMLQHQLTHWYLRRCVEVSYHRLNSDHF